MATTQSVTRTCRSEPTRAVVSSPLGHDVRVDTARGARHGSNPAELPVQSTVPAAPVAPTNGRDMTPHVAVSTWTDGYRPVRLFTWNVLSQRRQLPLSKSDCGRSVALLG